MMLTKDDEYREKRNRELYKILKKKDQVLKIFDDIYQKNLEVLLNDTTNEVPSRYFKYEMEKSRKNLLHNFALLEKYLSYSRVFIETLKTNDQEYKVLIKPDSNAPIKTNKFLYFVDNKYIGKIVDVINVKTNRKTSVQVKTFDEKYASLDLTDIFLDDTFSLSLDEQLEPKKKVYEYRLKFSDKLYGNSVVFYNDLTSKGLLQRDIYTVIVDETKVDEKNMFLSADKFIKNHQFLKLEKIGEKQVLLKEGTYEVLEDIVLPYGVSLKIEAGTNISLGENSSILLYGNLEILGMEKNKVIISNKHKNKPFGTIAAVGDGTTSVFIKHLEIKGGKEDKINGMHLSGALSLYNHNKVDILNSYIHHNSADDGLNIKNAKILLKNNIFNANMADQVDLDFCLGVVEGNKFIEKSLISNFDYVTIPTDDNGDGLDFSGSKIIVKNNIFNGFLDKGISVGEHTETIVYENQFLNNRSGLTSKDQSKVFVLNNIYENNKIDIEMYQKKVFNHPSVFNIDDSHNLNKIKKTKESHYYKLKEKDSFKIEKIDLETIDYLKNLDWIEYE